MNAKILEILDILQEECGEVVVAASKVKRFGLHASWANKPNNQENLTQEVGDIMALVGLLVDNKVLDMNEIEEARKAKIEKLKKWSTIFVDVQK